MSYESDRDAGYNTRLPGSYIPESVQNHDAFRSGVSAHDRQIKSDAFVRESIAGMFSGGGNSSSSGGSTPASFTAPSVGGYSRGGGGYSGGSSAGEIAPLPKFLEVLSGALGLVLIGSVIFGAFDNLNNARSSPRISASSAFHGVRNFSAGVGDIITGRQKHPGPIYTAIDGAQSIVGFGVALGAGTAAFAGGCAGIIVTIVAKRALS